MSDVMDKLNALNDTQKEINEERCRIEQVMKMQHEHEQLKAQLTELRGKEFALRKMAEEKAISEVKKQELLLEAARIKEHIMQLDKVYESLDSKLKEENTFSGNKQFDKYKCFANIRELLKNTSIKIGQIEKEAGCQPGYMSRLDKVNNSSEPSVEFLVTAAKLLGVSIDVLVSVDLTAMTATEQYLVSFLDKLKTDTIADRLEWTKLSQNELDAIHPDCNGCVDHPLFDLNEFYEEGEYECPERVTRVTFTSEAFGCATAINDDCYSLKLKNRSVLYLMDLCKSVYRVNDTDAFAKEVWMYTPGARLNFLVSNRNIQYMDLVNVLFETVKENVRHPQIKKNVKFIMDAFMNNDFEDDEEELPFN